MIKILRSLYKDPSKALLGAPMVLSVVLMHLPLSSLHGLLGRAPRICETAGLEVKKVQQGPVRVGHLLCVVYERHSYTGYPMSTSRLPTK